MKKSTNTDESSEYAVRRLCEREGESSPINAIVKCVQRLFIRHLGQQEVSAPVDLLKLAREAGIAISISEDPHQVDGTLGEWAKARSTLTPNGNAFTIRIMGARPRTRLNAALGHEIGHTFFYENTGGIICRPLGLPAGPEEENLCEFAARTLLMPREVMCREWDWPIDIGNLASKIMECGVRCQVSPYLVSQRLISDFTPKEIGVMFRAVGLWQPRREVFSYHAALLEICKPIWVVSGIPGEAPFKAFGSLKSAASRLTKRSKEQKDSTLILSGALHGSTILTVLARRQIRKRTR